MRPTSSLILMPIPDERVDRRSLRGVEKSMDRKSHDLNLDLNLRTCPHGPHGPHGQSVHFGLRTPRAAFQDLDLDLYMNWILGSPDECGGANGPDCWLRGQEVNN